MDTFATVLELCEGGDLDSLLREHGVGEVGHVYSGRGWWWSRCVKGWSRCWSH